MPVNENQRDSTSTVETDARQPVEADKKNKEDKKNKKDKGSRGVNMAIAVICCVLEFFIFVLCVVGTPIDVFQSRVESSPRYCYSVWGHKRCGAHSVNPNKLRYKGFPTSMIQWIMNASAAFSIISIFATLVSLVLTILLALKCVRKIAPGVCSIVAFSTTLIVWACQAGTYYWRYNVTRGQRVVRTRIGDHYYFAASFGLFVTAWCLQTTEVILVFFA